MTDRREEARRIATDWLDAYMQDVVCEECGAQPVEWHHDDHPSRPNARVSSLRTQGASIERIKAEIEKCAPLCRVCHMKRDGRLRALREHQPYQKGQVYVPSAPCSCCKKEAKPLRRGMCTGCYNHHQGIRLRKTASCDGCCGKRTAVVI